MLRRPCGQPRCLGYQSRSRLQIKRFICASSKESSTARTLSRTSKATEADLKQAYDEGFKAGLAAANGGQGSGKDKSQHASMAMLYNAMNASAGIQWMPAHLVDAHPTDILANDSLLRSALKGLVWRVFSTAATISIAIFIFKDLIQVQDALKFGALEFFAKYGLYFVHERIWALVPLL